ncbi:efflux RND transporter periplasmic adaptor subunit [Candidatus Uabimicrobium sp. HlEnr_7]|uniref:efflux RND transporter periplasmic adaptor subunit n=1 Tax=Candidatus Uabimicrobium helgolandensis TaxID=3095367 RepID=UPI0035589C85
MKNKRRKIDILDTSTHKIYKNFESSVNQKSSGSTRISELDVLKIQRNIYKVIKRYDEPQEFYNALFLFIIKLTNARGVAHFVAKDKEIDLSHQVILTSSSEKSKLIIETIQNLAKKALVSEEVAIEKVDNWVVLAVPILSEKSTNSGLACLLEIVDADQLSPYILILQFIASHIPLIADRNQKDILQTQAMRSSSFVDLLREISADKSFDKGIDQLLSTMKRELGCDRIAIGTVRGKRARLLALSNIVKFDRRARLVQLIENAMKEALQQEKTIEHPLINDKKREIQLDISHQALQQETKSKSIVTSLVKDENSSFGVWCFFWDETKPKKEDIFFVEAVALYITPILILLKKKSFIVRRRENSPWFKKIAFATIFALVSYFVLMMPYPHYVSASCSLEPVETRTISIPFDSVIQRVNYQIGDTVKKGQKLIFLDGREIRLEYFAVKEQLQSTRKTMLQLLAEKKIAEYQAEMLKAQKIEKQLELLEYRLEKINIYAPQDGIITQGDLEKATGVTVRKGEPIMEIAPLDEFFVKLEIDELDMAFVQKNMKIEIQLYSFFDKKWQAQLSYISPKVETSEQKNIFVCKAKISNPQQKLLPGMSGQARIYISEKRVWWVWLHKPIAWAKAKLWW